MNYSPDYASSFVVDYGLALAKAVDSRVLSSLRLSCDAFWYCSYDDLYESVVGID